MHAQWNAPQAALQHNFTELDQVPRDTLNYIFSMLVNRCVTTTPPTLNYILLFFPVFLHRVSPRH
jgi:hypothetical protein